VYGRNRDLVFGDLNHAWLSNATNTDGANISLSGSPYEETLGFPISAGCNTNFREKYLLNATIRF
jgi:hypothetical protein